MPCVANWPLILEYAKVLAAPLGNLITASVIVWLGLRAFRKQKAIERRLDWYQAMHRHLGDLATTYNLAALVTDPGRAKHHTERAIHLSATLAGVSNECWLYADQASFEATQVFVHQMATTRQAADSRGSISPALAAQVTDLCHATANTLAAGMRRELRQPDLTALSKAMIDKRVSPAA